MVYSRGRVELEQAALVDDGDTVGEGHGLGLVVGDVDGDRAQLALEVLQLAAGFDAETGVVMLLYLTLAHRRHRDEGRLSTKLDLREAIVDGAARRLRPKLMTVATMIIGLVPVLFSNGTGADVMKRIAAPMVGGLVTSFLLELTVYPAIFAIWKGRGLSEGLALASTPGGS